MTHGGEESLKNVTLLHVGEGHGNLFLKITSGDLLTVPNSKRCPKRNERNYQVVLPISRYDVNVILKK